jgi:three-Cys-motif partner protein
VAGSILEPAEVIKEDSTTKPFFSTPTPQSMAKTRIVSSYFASWAKIMMPRATSGKIAYIDLFAGPGRYADDSASTPIRILKHAVSEPPLKEGLVTLFNDIDQNNSGALEKAINEVPEINSLKYKPVVEHGQIDEQIVKYFEDVRLIPTFFFIDPFGYKGVSLKLINSILKDWGCDGVFFFNYNRINAALGNPYVKHHMDALFEEGRAEQLRQEIKGEEPRVREEKILSSMSDALISTVGRFVLPFRFKNQHGTRTSHYLIFVAKNVLGYEIMKNIMAGESTRKPQGVPSFIFDPQDRENPKLLDSERPLDDLKIILCQQFRGETSTMLGIYERHSYGLPYIKANYKMALGQLEEEGRIIADPPAPKRRKGTFSDNTIVAFI